MEVIKFKNSAMNREVVLSTHHWLNLRNFRRKLRIFVCWTLPYCTSGFPTHRTARNKPVLEQTGWRLRLRKVNLVMYSIYRLSLVVGVSAEFQATESTHGTGSSLGGFSRYSSGEHE
ncbi:unnamed protein product [Nesidiocoris tenuis]|uniref:Uncharacterized protein n=1 Tax=Nesidiocoris tenuis TaxID=355587 RepID=A0A6H5HT56_9HEMI|nr:unnamed protein product [Nesidiocoris tenuis]